MHGRLHIRHDAEMGAHRVPAEGLLRIAEEHNIFGAEFDHLAEVVRGEATLQLGQNVTCALLGTLRPSRWLKILGSPSRHGRPNAVSINVARF